MQWVAGAYIYTCTGGLIADSDTTTQIPYFLTANHCLSSNRTAQSLETYFQFSIPCGSTSCPGQTNPGGIQRLGATVKASGTAGDYTLLQLSQAPPTGSVFLGWNNTPIASTNNAALYRISHPAWAPQAYSAHHVDTTAVTCTGWPRGERIYSRDDAGATEGGSSGSPVVNSASQIVGQLSGACGYNTADPCDKTSNATVDGAFAYYYASVAPFLAAGGGGTCKPAGGTCTANSQCCSKSCKGKGTAKTCQ
jgi:V8-like Glu-specific endopeptidase